MNTDLKRLLRRRGKKQIPARNILLAATICAALLATSAQAQFQWSKRVASISRLPNDGPGIGMTLDSQGKGSPIRAGVKP
jgi:hypothetical protein